MYSKGFITGIIFFLVFSVSAAGALEKNTGNTDLWHVCLFSLDGTKLSSEFSYLEDSIPFSMQNTLKYVEMHSFTKKEKFLWLQRKKEEESIKVKKELSALYKKRDLLLFSGKMEDKVNVELEITRKKEDLRRLKLNTSDIPEDSINAEVTFEDSCIPVDEIPNLKGYDQAVYGTLETIDRWLFLSVSIYNYVTGENREIYAGLTDPEDINNTADSVSAMVKEVVSGRTPPVLIVKGSPADAFFNLNGGEDYLAGSPVTDLTSGNYSLTVHRKGYEDEKKSIQLKEGENTKVEYSLKRKYSGFAVISTVPSGADMYMDSVWMGRSPLILEDPVLPSYLKVEKEGYISTGRMLEDKQDNKNISIILTPSKVKKDQIRENRRKKFYNSLGMFIVSLAVPVVSYGISSDYGYAFNSSIQSYSIPDSESERLMSMSNTWYSVYLGGMFVSASLFIDMAIKLGNYISFY